MADDDWAEVLRIFKPPWKILDRENGGVRIEDATGRSIIFIYHRGNDTQNWKRPSHDEALLLARAIARMSKK